VRNLKILKELRTHKNITQQELADYLKVNRNAISRYETGEREPDIEMLIKISDFFEVSVDYLLGKSEKKSSANAEGDKGNNRFEDDIGSLSPESQAKAKEYIEMLKTLDKLKPEEKPVDLNKKA
jgi:transcriptional regulator with XRE-family HTH domain